MTQNSEANGVYPGDFENHQPLPPLDPGDRLFEVPNLSVTVEPLRLQILSEPYVIFTRRGYQCVALVMNQRRKSTHMLFLSAGSLANQLEPLRKENGGHLSGLEFWVRKASPEKTSKYIIE